MEIVGPLQTLGPSHFTFFKEWTLLLATVQTLGILLK
jgi:hypothetical protein